MPVSNTTPTNRTYHSGVFRHLYVLPDCREDPAWVGQWKFDDISSGSGLDSQKSNHLIGSGGPTQCIGNRQSSGVQFDGVNDCFYLNWNLGSGLEGIVSFPRIRNVITASQEFSHWGFTVSLKVTDMSKDQFILSKWNEVGNDREWGIGINPSGGFFFQFKEETSNNLICINSARASICPSGQWFDLTFAWNGVSSNDTVNGSTYLLFINDQIVADCTGKHIDKAGASGVFMVGAANYGKTPSGFFGGCMEDLRFFNGRTPSLPNYNAYHSGVVPLSTYPVINDTNPYIAAHFQFNTAQSGFTDTNQITQTSYVIERRNNQHCASSGTLGFRYNALTNMLRPGEDDGTKGSGLALTATNPGEAFYKRITKVIKPDTLWFNHSFTIMGWVRFDVANTDDPNLFGNDAVTPLATYQCGFTDCSRPRLNVAHDGGVRDILTATPAPTIGLSSGIWAHVAWVYDLDQSIAEFYVSGMWKDTKVIAKSGLWNAYTDPTLKDFQIGQSSENVAVNGFSGILDEFIFFNYAVPSGQIVAFYSAQSGYLPTIAEASGMEGGWTNGISALPASGELGGYVIVGTTKSGVLGGWESGIPAVTSGMLGGYVIIGPSASGKLGSYVIGEVDRNAYIGGYTLMAGVAGNFEGGYLRGVEPVDQDSSFVAFFNVIGRDKKEFDAQVSIIKSFIKDFDARVTIYKDEKKPLVGMVTPLISQSGTIVPISYRFEAQASGQQGKSIYRTFWFFSDTTSTSGSIHSSSGTYYTEHTFAQSGLFDVIFVAIDDKGIINSVRTIINTASGANLPTISLTATPESGTVPLSVAFSGVINSAPSTILDKYIYFGDGTRSPSTSSIYKMYPVIGCYIPVFRVRDSRGFIVTDSTVVGVNN